jgi:hypothetical protein
LCPFFFVDCLKQNDQKKNVRLYGKGDNDKKEDVYLYVLCAIADVAAMPMDLSRMVLSFVDKMPFPSLLYYGQAAPKVCVVNEHRILSYRGDFSRRGNFVVPVSISYPPTVGEEAEVYLDDRVLEDACGCLIGYSHNGSSIRTPDATIPLKSDDVLLTIITCSVVGTMLYVFARDIDLDSYFKVFLLLFDTSRGCSLKQKIVLVIPEAPCHYHYEVDSDGKTVYAFKYKSPLMVGEITQMGAIEMKACPNFKLDAFHYRPYANRGVEGGFFVPSNVVSVFIEPMTISRYGRDGRLVASAKVGPFGKKGYDRYSFVTFAVSNNLFVASERRSACIWVPFQPVRTL